MSVLLIPLAYVWNILLATDEILPSYSNINDILIMIMLRPRNSHHEWFNFSNCASDRFGMVQLCCICDPPRQ